MLLIILNHPNATLLADMTITKNTMLLEFSLKLYI